MRKRRRRRKPDPGRMRHTAAFVGLALLVPLTVNYLVSHLDALSRAGENAAMLAAAIAMPESSLDLLEERFRAEIYNPDDLPTPVVPDVSRPVEPDAAQDSGTGEPDSGSATPRKPAPKIPEEYAAPLISENFAGYEGGTLVKYGAGFIKNETRWDDEDVLEILDTPMSLQFDDTDQPQVLIVHTHATESFESYDSDTYDLRNTWRSTNNNSNMVAVGDVFAQVLEERGISVLHDTTQHDYPSYNGSYERSADTIESYLELYPSIKVVLDLHRDAMARDDAIVKPVTTINGKKAAQIMIISGCDDGTMDMPQWRQNLRFAAQYANYMEERYPELTRPVYLCYRKYNMDLTTGSLLLEFGSNANTLEEAMYSAELASEALAQLILENTVEETMAEDDPEADLDQDWDWEDEAGDFDYDDEDIDTEGYLE